MDSCLECLATADFMSGHRMSTFWFRLWWILIGYQLIWYRGVSESLHLHVRVPSRRPCRTPHFLLRYGGLFRVDAVHVTADRTMLIPDVESWNGYLEVRGRAHWQFDEKLFNIVGEYVQAYSNRYYFRRR